MAQITPRRLAYNPAARVETGSRKAAPSPRPIPCRYHATGTFCNHACEPCGARLLDREAKARTQRESLDEARAWKAGRNGTLMGAPTGR